MRNKNIKRLKPLRRVVLVDGQKWTYKVGHSFCLIKTPDASVSKLVPIYQLLNYTIDQWQEVIDKGTRPAITPWHVQTYVERLLASGELCAPTST